MAKSKERDLVGQNSLSGGGKTTCTISRHARCSRTTSSAILPFFEAPPDPDGAGCSLGHEESHDAAARRRFDAALATNRTIRPTMPLRVVHLMSGDLWAGAEVMAWQLLTHLHDSPGCHVTAICLNEGVLADKLRDDGLDVHVLNERNLSLMEIVRAAATLFRGTRPHILHSHRYKEHAIAALLAPFFGARLWATVHGLPEPSAAMRLRDVARDWSTFRLLRHRFHQVIAVSAVMKEILVTTYGFRRDLVHTIHNGIPLPTSGRVRPPDPRVRHIGSVGRLVPVKRFPLFLETAALVRQAHPDVMFSILGTGPERVRLLRLARALNLDGCFRILDLTPDPSAYYRSVDLYMNTSQAEGLPLSVLEAMACGTPVVAADVGGIPEIVEHGVNGWLVEEPHSPAAFAAACARLIGDRALRDRLGSAATQTVSAHFAAASMARQYVELYDQVTTGTVPSVAEPATVTTRRR